MRLRVRLSRRRKRCAEINHACRCFVGSAAKRWHTLTLHDLVAVRARCQATAIGEGLPIGDRSYLRNIAYAAPFCDPGHL